MGYYVHLQVSWNNGTPEQLKPLAEKHLALIKQREIFESKEEAEWFLGDVISGKSYFPGRKGDFWAWGTIGNYTVADEFIEAVKPFFADCYVADYIFDFERILFMCEPEQSESVQIYQLMPKDEKELDNLIVLEFSSEGKWYWGQM